MVKQPFEDVSSIKKWWFSIAMLNYHLNKTMGSCLESSFSCWVGDEEKDAAAKIDLDKQRAEASGGRLLG